MFLASDMRTIHVRAGQNEPARSDRDLEVRMLILSTLPLGDYARFAGLNIMSLGARITPAQAS